MRKIRLLINSYFKEFNNLFYSTAALNRFNTWMSNGMPDDQSIKDFKLTIYCLGIKYGNKKVWNQLWQKFLNSSDQKEKNIILSALGCSKDDETLKVCSNFCLISSSNIPTHFNRVDLKLFTFSF